MLLPRLVESVILDYPRLGLREGASHWAALSPFPTQGWGSSFSKVARAHHGALLAADGGVYRGVEEASGRDRHDGRLGAVREVQASTGRAVGRHLAVAPSVTDLFLHLHPKNSYSS